MKPLLVGKNNPQHRRSLLLIELRGTECRAKIECSCGAFTATAQSGGELTTDRAEDRARDSVNAAWYGHLLSIGLEAGFRAVAERLKMVRFRPHNITAKKPKKKKPGTRKAKR